MDNKDLGNGSRRYTVNELCELRLNLPVVVCAISRINKHPDIAGIFTLPEDALNAPVRFSCETKKLANLSKKPTIPQNARRLLANTSEESEYQDAPQISASVESQNAHWNLRRRREDSERSSQPFSAPSGLVAQQSENFQRFYRAVVSPTHVRVTAGGRIVPNTRVSVPPVFEWNPEKQHFEPAQSPPDESNHPLPTFWPPNTSVSAFPSFSPPPPNGVMSQYQLLPPPGKMLPMMAHQFTDKKPLEGETDLSFNGEMISAAPQPIKISPPSQFDQTKPFMYNGQIVYPVPQGFLPPSNAVPIPMGVLGSGLPQHQQQKQQPQMHMPPMPLQNMPFMFPPGHHFPMQAPQPFGYPHHPMGLPNMVSVSQLTKNQIHDLNNLLKNIDHQLANNAHQIDVGHMMMQRAHVQSQINTMQSILMGQLGTEMNGYTGARGESASENSERGSSTPAQKQVVLASSSSAMASGVQSTNAESPSHGKVQSVAQSNGPTSRAASNSISRLSAAAAMAPPFQPRSVQQPNILPTSPEDYDLRGAYNLPLHTREGSVGYAGSSGVQSLPEASPNMGGNLIGLQRAHTFHGQTAAGMTTTVASDKQHPDVPYLVGSYPTGMKESEATFEDLTYSRPLTDEEVRARYLYWGKAPRHIQSGLPKFDGKDFYPPSPVKDVARLATPRSFRNTARPVLPDFSGIFTGYQAPGYKTPSPVRLANFGYGQTVAAKESVGIPPSQRRYFTDSLESVQPINGDQVSSKSTAGGPDFSTLFLESGGPGYNELSPLQGSSQAIVSTNTDNSTSVKDWSLGAKENATPSKNGENSECSTIDIRLSPQVLGSSKGKGPGVETPFAERVANFSNTEQQTLFLQNMLRNTATMSSPALMGGITSATAQGFLPVYRGSAAASLSPTVLNVAAADRGLDASASRIESPKVVNGSTFGVKVLSENRPLSRAIPIVRPSTDTMDAEGYMRYLSQKAADDQQNKDQGWNHNTTGKGPVSGGSEW